MKTPLFPRALPPQLSRLCLLTLMIVGGYFGARHFLTPETFGAYGWFRGNALHELAGRPTTYAGRKACVDCHEDLVKKMAASKHLQVSCESCHGPNQAHVEDPTTTPAKISNPRFCLRCHQANPSRPEKFPQVNPADHFGDQACAECHQPHSPTESPGK